MPNQSGKQGGGKPNMQNSNKLIWIYAICGVLVFMLLELIIGDIAGEAGFLESTALSSQVETTGSAENSALESVSE